MNKAHIIALSQIGRYGNDFTVIIVFLQPRNDDGRIETAGISKNNFFDFVFFLHDRVLLLSRD